VRGEIQKNQRQNTKNWAYSLCALRKKLTKTVTKMTEKMRKNERKMRKNKEIN